MADLASYLWPAALALFAIATFLDERRLRRVERRVAELVELLTVRACRVCGCTDDEGCMFGCTWVEEDLCSSCAPEAEG